MSGSILKHSIVHEYEILYSSRILQKDKRWSDGKLKFYELNSKVEILNEDDILIETDFFDKKNVNLILNSKLISHNQFKLTNKSLLIEVGQKLAVYERDISKSFKKSQNNTCLIETKRCTVKEETTSNIANSPSISKAVKPRTIGLTRVVKREPCAMQKETGIIKATPSTSSIIVKRESKSSDISKIKINKEVIQEYDRPCINVKKEVIQHIPSLMITPGKPLQVDRKKLYIKSKYRRIPPFSSKIFKSLIKQKFEEFLEEENTISESRNSESNAQPQVKMELPKGGTNLEDCDVIYDLSDFEEDEKFMEMLSMRQNSLQRKLQENKGNNFRLYQDDTL